MAKKTENTEDKEKKPLKLNIQNKQIAKAVNLKSIKEKLSQKKSAASKEKPVEVTPEQEAPRVKARSKSAFAEEKPSEVVENIEAKEAPLVETPKEPESVTTPPPAPKVEPKVKLGPIFEKKPEPKAEPKKAEPPKFTTPAKKSAAQAPMEAAPKPPVRQKLGPTGRHINDLLPKPKPPAPKPTTPARKPAFSQSSSPFRTADKKKGAKTTNKPREFRDMKSKPFNSRDRHGLSSRDDPYSRYRKRRPKHKTATEDTTIRPSSLSIRLPISIKNLAAEMKLKASQLIQELFKHGLVATINDELDDETTLELLGTELKCELTIDKTEEKRIQITDKSVNEEIKETSNEELIPRAPIVAFMGHVDHGKTSLVDKIRSSNVAEGEAGAITQHIGAFRCSTPVGDIAILDTPGHEAFSAMRSRGASATDIVVLVIAGDEGIKQQTLEAIDHAKEAGVTIVVAINKCDKPNFNADNIYRQLSEHELLPESWGGSTITVNCSAVSGEGIQTLLEMIALQAEVLELRANPKARARGTVLESEMHKGMGSVATILIQNGTLKKGDSLVVGGYWAKIKTMHDEHNNQLDIAGPSTPVEITGLSGIPDAGTEFIVVASEKEAKNIAQTREQERRMRSMQKKAPTIESMLAEAKQAEMLTFNVMICADVQGSLEALETALNKIKSDKVLLNIVAANVGEVSESTIQMSATSGAAIIGFHTKLECRAEPLTKQLGVEVKLHDIIYHAVDDVKEMMRAILPKLAEEKDCGEAEVIQTFKSSHLGIIAGCKINDGIVNRNHKIRVIRGGEVIWKGPLNSIKREKDDVKEVTKGLECGIVLQGFREYEVGDLLQSFETIYLEQKLND